MSSGSKEHIGKVAIAECDMKLSYGAFCAKLSPRNNFSNLLHLIITSNQFKLYIKQICIGTNINNLTTDNILNYKIVQIPQDLLLRFNNLISPIRGKINTLNNENQRLEKLREFILPILMNGQVIIQQ